MPTVTYVTQLGMIFPEAEMAHREFYALVCDNHPMNFADDRCKMIRDRWEDGQWEVFTGGGWDLHNRPWRQGRTVDGYVQGPVCADALCWHQSCWDRACRTFMPLIQPLRRRYYSWLSGPDSWREG